MSILTDLLKGALKEGAAPTIKEGLEAGAKSVAKEVAESEVKAAATAAAKEAAESEVKAAATATAKDAAEDAAAKVGMNTVLAPTPPPVAKVGMNTVLAPTPPPVAKVSAQSGKKPIKRPAPPKEDATGTPLRTKTPPKFTGTPKELYDTQLHFEKTKLELKEVLNETTDELEQVRIKSQLDSITHEQIKWDMYSGDSVIKTADDARNALGDEIVGIANKRRTPVEEEELTARIFKQFHTGKHVEVDETVAKSFLKSFKGFAKHELNTIATIPDIITAIDKFKGTLSDEAAMTAATTMRNTLSDMEKAGLTHKRDITKAVRPEEYVFQVMDLADHASKVQGLMREIDKLGFEKVRIEHPLLELALHQSTVTLTNKVASLRATEAMYGASMRLVGTSRDLVKGYPSVLKTEYKLKQIQLAGGKDALEQITSGFRAGEKSDSIVSIFAKAKSNAFFKGYMNAQDAMTALVYDSVIGFKAASAALIGGSVKQLKTNAAIFSAEVFNLFAKNPKGMQWGATHARLNAWNEVHLRALKGLSSFSDGTLDEYLKISNGRISGAEKTLNLIPQMLNYFGKSKSTGMTGPLGKTIHYMLETTALGPRSVQVADRYMSTVALEMNLAEISHNAAIFANNPYRSQGYFDYIKAVRGDKEKYKEIWHEAMLRTHDITYTHPYKDLTLGGMFESIDKANRFVPFLPTMSMFWRFVANSFDDTLRQVSPYLNNRARANLAAGGARAQTEAMEGVISAMSIAGGAYLAMEGYTQGSGPKNPMMAAMMRDLGYHPNTLKVDGVHYELSRLNPASFPLLVAADAVELLKHVDTDKNPEAVPDLLLGVLALSSHFGMQHIVDLNTTLGDMSDVMMGEDKGKAMSRVAGKLGFNLTPGSGLAKQVNDIVNTFTVPASDIDSGVVKKETREFGPDMNFLNATWETIKNEWLAVNPIPGYSDALTHQVGLFGEPRYIPNGFTSDAFSPIAFHKDTPDSRVVFKELINLGMTAPVFKLSMPPGLESLLIEPVPYSIGTAAGVRVQLNHKQRHTFQLLSAGKGLHPEYLDAVLPDDMPREGLLNNNLMEAMKYQIDNGYPWATANDGPPASGVHSKNAKVIAIKQIVHSYRRASVTQMQVMYPDLMDRAAIEKRGRSESLGNTENTALLNEALQERAEFDASSEMEQMRELMKEMVREQGRLKREGE